MVLFQGAVKGISNGTLITSLKSRRIEMTFKNVIPGMRMFYEVLHYVPGIPSTAQDKGAIHFPEYTVKNVIPGMHLFYEVLHYVPGIPATAQDKGAIHFPGIHCYETNTLF